MGGRMTACAHHAALLPRHPSARCLPSRRRRRHAACGAGATTGAATVCGSGAGATRVHARRVSTVGSGGAHARSITTAAGGRDHYATMGLERDCSSAELRQRYAQLVLQLHPDTAVATAGDDRTNDGGLVASVGVPDGAPPTVAEHAAELPLVDPAADTASSAADTAAEAQALGLSEAQRTAALSAVVEAYNTLRDPESEPESNGSPPPSHS
jgi:hypothetical protein